MEIKCNECQKISVPTWNAVGQIPDICDECMKLGWLDVNTPEGQEALKHDKELNGLISRESLYFKKP